jgi:hypothetical protein
LDNFGKWPKVDENHNQGGKIHKNFKATSLNLKSLVTNVFFHKILKQKKSHKPREIPK